MKMNALIIMIVMMLASCGEHLPSDVDNKPPVEKKDTVFELVWETLMDSTQDVVGGIYHQIWKNTVIFSGRIEDPPTLYAFDKQSGKLLWKYINKNGLKDKIIYSAVKEDIYIGITNDGVFGFDLNNRQMKWQINQNQMNIEFGWNMTIRGDYIYQPVYWNFGQVNNSSAKIIRIQYNTGEFETVYEIASVDSLMDGFSAPVFWENPYTGHDIMFFNNQNWNYFKSPQEVSQDLIAVDVNTRQVLWCNAEFTPVASNGAIHPIMYKDNIITGGDWSMYSFDARTGKLNWKREFVELKPWSLWGTAEHLIEDNRLYCKDDGRSIWCLNADTGEVIWHNPDDGSNCKPSTIYYKDMLVYVSWGKGAIMVLDAFTGKRIHKERSHNNSTFFSDVVYDKETDMFFTKDFIYAYGFKIHKPE